MNDTDMQDATPDQSGQARNFESVVKNGMKDGKPIGESPYMGTADRAVSYEPNTPCARNLKELHEEFKQYRLLRKKDEMQSNQEVGTPAYVVSTKWLKAYHEFVMYDEFDSGSSEEKVQQSLGDDHFKAKHPGKMRTKEDLGEKDPGNENLYGTNGDMGKGYEADYLDAYIDQQHTN